MEIETTRELAEELVQDVLETHWEAIERDYLIDGFLPLIEKYEENFRKRIKEKIYEEIQNTPMPGTAHSKGVVDGLNKAFKIISEN